MAPKKTEPVEVVEAAPLKPYTDIHKILVDPVDKNLLRWRSAKKDGPKTIAYINVTDYKDLLDFRVGPAFWTSEVTQFKQISESLCVVVRIAIRTIDGTIFHDGTGISPIAVVGFGDPFSNAYSQAFRRACEGHGLSRELWRTEEANEMFANEMAHQSAAPPANVPPPAQGGKVDGWSPEASNQAANEIPNTPPATDAPPPPPLVDFGNGAAKKNENKFRDLCKNLNAAGAPYFDPTEGERKWNSEALESYCQHGFDKALAQMDDDETAIMIQDLEEMLAERLSMTAEANRSDTPATATSSGEVEMITEKQLAGLVKFCDMKKANESKVAEEVSGGRCGTFGALTSEEAGNAIKVLMKMKTQ